jgi:hypothetical protein
MKSTVYMALLLALGGCDELAGWQLGPGQTVRAGPCDGYRTEALLVLDAVTWAGCGADPGLYSATSLSAGFSAVPGLESMHVFDLQAGPDGRLWITGDEVSSTELLYALDTVSGQIEPLLNYDGASMRLSAGHNIAWTSDGTTYVDSLTGNYLAASDDHGESWTEHYLDGHQIMDMVVHDDAIWAVGSTIAQPPTVWSRQDGGMLKATELRVGWSGALEAVEVAASGRVVAGGVDEALDSTALITCVEACDQPDSWRSVDVAALGLTDGGKVWALHFDGDDGVAVGERYPQSRGGFVLTTSDGGASWRLQDGEHAILTAAFVRPDGSWVVAGGDTFLAEGG